MVHQTTGKALETGGRAILREMGLEAQAVTGTAGGGVWLLDVEISNRRFIFGSTPRDGYSFTELKGGKEVSFLSSEDAPLHAPNDLLWKRSFEILRIALEDPNFKGPKTKVV
jgi:hypothetical protein